MKRAITTTARRLLAIVLVNSIPAASAAADYYVVTGSFASRSGAATHEQHIDQHFDNNHTETATVSGRQQYRVTLGPFASEAAAKQAQEKAIELGMQGAWTYQRNETDPAVNQPPQMAAAKNASSRPPISQLQQIKVNRFVYSSPALNAEVDALLSPHIGSEVTTSELLSIKEQINQLYAAQGYVNSGVLIPDQQIQNGEVTLDFVSGKITDVQLDSALRHRYVMSRLDVQEPFNLIKLQESLKMLEQDPMVSRIDARVAPGLERGEATLALQVETRPQVQINLTAANDRSPSIGSENGRINMTTSNLTGWGETFQIGSSVTRGLDAFDASLVLPITASGAQLQFQYSVSDSSVIEEPFDEIDVDSKTESVGVVFSLPLQQTLTKMLALQLTLEGRRNQTSLLGQPFSFSAGAINGESRVAPVRLAVAYTEQNIDDSLAARLSISRGTSKFDATRTSNSADGVFTSYLAQIQYSRRIGEQTHITARALAQYAEDPLLSVERYALGGISTVRGYRQNQVVRDNAYLASLELHYRPDWPVWIDFVAFLDWGQGKNHSDAMTSGSTSLSSMGLGVQLHGWRGLNLELFVARGFDDFEATEYDLQDDGIHFRLGYQHEF